MEELENVDEVFEEYESTLFNRDNMEFERSMQTQEANDQLNVTIKRFLITLSPYFLLRSSQKALEWLLFRFVAIMEFCSHACKM